MQINKIGTNVLSVFFPTKCYICGSEADLLCKSCKSQFIIPATRCVKCGRALPDAYSNYICQTCFTGKPVFNGGIAFFKYTDTIRSWIHNIKYGKNSYQIRIMDLFKSQIVEAISQFKPDILVPIPLTIEHSYLRGFNQSLLIAKKIANWINLPVATALKKTKFTESQTTVGADKRKRNVRNSFTASKKVKDRRVMLVDDVFTTGSTINEAAKTLKKYTDTVYFFAIAGT